MFCCSRSGQQILRSLTRLQDDDYVLKPTTSVSSRLAFVANCCAVAATCSALAAVCSAAAAASWLLDACVSACTPAAVRLETSSDTAAACDAAAALTELAT